MSLPLASKTKALLPAHPFPKTHTNEKKVIYRLLQLALLLSFDIYKYKWHYKLLLQRKQFRLKQLYSHTEQNVVKEMGNSYKNSLVFTSSSLYVGV